MTAIVDNPPAVAISNGDNPDGLEAIYQRLLDQEARFLDSVDGIGPKIYSPFELAMLVHEYATEYATATVRAVAGDLGIADGEVRRLVDLVLASGEAIDRLRDENTQLRTELADRGPVT